MDWNKHEVCDVIDFAVEMGAMASYLFFLIPVGRGVFIEGNAVEVQEYEDLLRTIMAKQKEVEAEWRQQNKELSRKLNRFLSLEIPEIDYHKVEVKSDTATRVASATMLGVYAEKIENMIVASADLSNSDKTGNIYAKPVGDRWKHYYWTFTTSSSASTYFRSRKLRMCFSTSLKRVSLIFSDSFFSKYSLQSMFKVFSRSLYRSSTIFCSSLFRSVRSAIIMVISSISSLRWRKRIRMNQ